MKENIKYTIVIPHKNTPELLNRCVGSIPIRNDVQIIVVDDNSSKDRKPCLTATLNIEEICISAKDSKGAGHARNVGIMHAKGKWLLFADADDYYCPNAFNILDSILYNDLDILYFNFALDGSCSDNKLKKMPIENDDIVRFGYWMPWNKVFSTNFIISNNLTYDEIPVGNDAFFCLTASKLACKYAIISEKLYVYTLDNKNSITNKRRSFDREMDCLKINCRINLFLYENKHFCSCIHLYKGNKIGKVFKLHGISKGVYYLLYLLKNWNIFKDLRCGIRKHLCNHDYRS